MAWCSKCQTDKPDDEFWKNSTAKSGLQAYCKSCGTRTNRQWQKDNPERCRELQAAQRATGRVRFDHIERRYGLTRDEWEAMFDEQGGLCAICHNQPIEHTDHDHESGNVRQLLCRDCNWGLGRFHDNPTWLREAADYVERHRSRVQGVAQDATTVSSERNGS